MAEHVEKTLLQNRKARHEYFFEEIFEAGIELSGTEVKSLRLGQANMGDAYAQVKDGELYLLSMHISPYDKGNIYNREPMRNRKLLMHKREIRRLAGQVQQKGFSLIPVRLYLKDQRVKVELALAKGKHLYDKRDDDADRTAKRDMERAFASRKYE
jgi:SsrA-binding protein